MRLFNKILCASTIMSNIIIAILFILYFTINNSNDNDNILILLFVFVPISIILDFVVIYHFTCKTAKIDNEELYKFINSSTS